MKKSKRCSKRKNRSHSPDEKSIHSKHVTKSEEKSKNEESGKAGPKKTRWGAEKASQEDKKAEAQPICSEKQEKSVPILRIKDLLHDKEKIIELLFQNVSGAALQELIPDYLKNRPMDELKKLCLEQLTLMTDENVLEVISEKSAKEKTEAEKVELVKDKTPEVVKDKPPEVVKKAPDVEEPKNKSEEIKSPEKPQQNQDVELSREIENSPSDVLELQPSINELESIDDDVTKVAMLIKDEVSKNLNIPERDAELLELEMRARAIRSLLKAKQSTAEDSPSKDEDI